MLTLKGLGKKTSTTAHETSFFSLHPATHLLEKETDKGVCMCVYGSFPAQ